MGKKPKTPPDDNVEKTIEEIKKRHETDEDDDIENDDEDENLEDEG